MDKYTRFTNEMKKLAASKDSLVGKTIFNIKAKENYGIIVSEPIPYDSDRHPNQYEIRVERKNPNKTKRDNRTTWWLSTSTDLKTDLVIVDDSGDEIIIDYNMTKKLEAFQNKLKKNEF